MNPTNTIDLEPVSEAPSMALERRGEQALAPINLFGTTDAVTVLEKAGATAAALKDVVKKQNLISNIQGKEYPRCEAWTLLGTILGVFPVLAWTKPVEGGWEARVEAKTLAGAVIGAAEAQCLRAERNWASRDDFALRSMAQTRATAKALRMPLGFVMTLAGYEATPAEEMVNDHQKPQTAQNRAKPAAQPNKPRQDAPGQAASAPAKAEQPQAFPPATEQTRAKMIRQLNDCLPLATEFWQRVTDPAVLMPNETLADLPLKWVPISRGQMDKLIAALKAFGDGEPARHPYPANPEAPKPAKGQQLPANAPSPTPARAISALAAAQEPEYFWDVICPIPRKGMKRDEYLRAPDTIRSLYVSMKTGDEAAGKRLWGFANHWKPEPRTAANGRVYQPSDADKKFREALDAFLEYEAKHGKDTAQPELPQGDDAGDSEIPF